MKKIWLINFALVPVLLSGIVLADSVGKPFYNKAAVQSVSAQVAGDSLRIRYKVPPVPMTYSPGVNYSIDSGKIRVVINSCDAGSSFGCKTPMAEARMLPVSPTASPTSFLQEAMIPYHGEKVFMVYGDMEEQIYP